MTAALPCLHVGFHKSASTTLQQHLFARHSGVMNVGRPEPEARAKAACDSILEAIAAHRAPDLARSRALWEEVRAEAEAAGKTMAFSRERLTRYMYYDTPGDRRLPDALAGAFAPARVVIVVRHQVRLLESLYVHKCKTSSYLAPGRWLEENLDGDVRMHSYFALAESYAQAFGAGNVLVLMLEQLARDPAAFARRLCRHIGIDAAEGVSLLADSKANVGKSERLYRFVGWRSKVLPEAKLGKLIPAPLHRGLHRLLSAGAPAQASFPPEWVARIESYHRADNRRLAERYGLPLAEFGYPL